MNDCQGDRQGSQFKAPVTPVRNSYRELDISHINYPRKEIMLHTSKPILLSLLLLVGILVFVSACGNSSTTTGATSSGTTTTQSVATATSSTDTSGYGGRYGSGGTSTTPTATKAVTGATAMVTITTDSTGTFTFSPKTITIKAGTTVIWKNTTQTPHTVTSNDGKAFNSGDSTPVAPSTTFSFKFTTAGTFAYHCDFHPFMTATIVVQ